MIADADAQVWEEFRVALGDSWDVVGVPSCAAALKEAEQSAFNVVVANNDLPETGGVELLNQIRQAHPKAIRFIAAAEALKDKVMPSVVGGDQFLALPLDSTALKLTIERSLAADYGMSKNVRDLIGRIRTFPTIPSLYLEVVNALQNPNANTADIGALIAKDMSMTTKLVQVLNSAYFGLPRTITDPTEAVGILGFETVKSLIMAVKLLSQYDKVKPVYFSIDNVWRHSTNVARTARVMALLESNSVEQSATAYTAGLMHDLGKVILAANFDDQYNGAHTLARKRQIPLWEVEKDIFGATHGEIGAYLLALWGMSEEVVKVAAMHHEPLRSGDKEFTPLTAVHVANALEYEGSQENEGLPAPVIDGAYLQTIGMADRIDLWRFARREPDAARVDRVKSTVSTPAQTPKPAPAERRAPVAREPLVPAFVWKWVGLSAGLATLVALAIQIEVTRFDTLATTGRPATPVVAEVAAPAKAAAKIEVDTHSVFPAKAIAAAPAKAASPAPSTPAKTGFDRLKLQAIFFSSQHPSALINGKLAEVNQMVADCRILDINPTSITLEYQNEQRTLKLR